MFIPGIIASVTVSAPAETLGPELVIDGDMTVPGSWVTNWTISGGIATAPGATGYMEQAPTIVGGTTYRVTLDVLAGATFVNQGLGIRIGPGGDTIQQYVTTIGAQSFDLTAPSSEPVFGFGHTNVDFAGSIDNVSVREIL